MKNFDMKRFGLLLRHDIVTYNRFYLKSSVAIFLCHFVMQMMVVYFSTRGAGVLRADKEEALYATCLLTAFAFSILMFFIGMSLTFTNLSSKSGCISYLMLPVSNFEKFVSRLSVFTFGFLLANAVLFVLADFLRMLLLLSMDGHIGLVTSSIPHFCSDVIEQVSSLYSLYEKTGRSVWALILSTSYGVLSFVFFCLMFLLGGIYFKKTAFVKTSVVMLLVSFFMGAVRVNVDIPLDYQQTSTPHLALCVSLALAFVIGAVWLCYYLFKRTTVVSRRWF